MGRRPLGDLSVMLVTLPPRPWRPNIGSTINAPRSSILDMRGENIFKNDPRLQCQPACRQHSREDGG